MEYPARFDPAPEGGLVVTFPDFRWGVMQGDTEAEAREVAADALANMIEEHIRSVNHCRGRVSRVDGDTGRFGCRRWRV
jgi:predicted RNase H-like HicB family nuclease